MDKLYGTMYNEGNSTVKTGGFVMRNKYKNEFLKCAMFGFVISVITNVMYVVSMYIYYPNWCVYVFMALIAFLLALMLIGESLKNLLCNIGVLLLSNVLTGLFLFFIGVTEYIYFIAHPTAPEIDIGDSLFELYLYVCQLAGIIAGSALSVLKMLMLRKKENE